jgi:hypothetical protein
MLPTRAPISLVGEKGRSRGVWFGAAMGLLDDAIREHLELKRRRGADPAEVAREQHEALDLPSSSSPESEQGPAADGGEGVEPADGRMALDRAEAGGALDDQLRAEPEAEFSSEGEHAGRLEETAELDMESMLESDAVHDDPLQPSPEVTGMAPRQEHLQLDHDPPTDPGLKR